ncbi:MAG: hypothetical protein O7E52_11810 [Candidatus Poribacteria bacterium]|nr:hypothetical protein [Candidatus Poribacteria bacterium]
MKNRIELIFTHIFLASVMIAQIAHAAASEDKHLELVEAELPGVSSIADLDRQAGLHFAIMSDNKGDSPLSSVEFARMVAWIGESNAAFVVGLGDHLKHRWENSFIPWLQSEPWWRKHFYPNVADGENEYYSPTHKQSDYGEGAPLLDLVDLDAHADVIRPNDAEYYARISVGDYTVHLIQIHFSDQPKEAEVAFPESSRAWMIETVKGIKKGEKDLIVVAAHSREGSWDRVISPERRRFLLNKADLVLSATTHKFQAWAPEGVEEASVICINTGAVNYPGFMTPNGYVEIHVVASTGAIVGQYIDLTQTHRRLQRGRFAWIKPKDGPMRYLDLRRPAPDDASHTPVATLSDPLDAVQINQALSTLLREKTGADLGLVGARNGLNQGPVTREDAWAVFQKNINLRVVRIPMAKAEVVFERLKLSPVSPDKDQIRIAAPHPNITDIISMAGLTYDAIEPQALDDEGLRQVDLLIEWLSAR